MPAEPVQQVCAGLQRGKEIEPPVRPAGPPARAVFQVDHEAGTGVFLAEAGGDNPHHPLVPLLAGEHQGAALLLAQSLNLLHRVGADSLFHGLPPPVLLAQLLGQLLGPGGIVGLQKVRRQVRRPHPSGGVDPGREHKTDLNGGDGLVYQSRLPQKGVDAHKIRMGQRLQPAGDDGPVLPLHPHDVGHGADGGQGAVAGEQGVLPALPSQSQHQFQRHAAARQEFERIGTVGPVRVHHRRRLRQSLLALVMVRHHHVHPQRGGEGHLLVSGDAAVHGDHQRGAPVPKALNGGLGQAVPVLNPPGNIAHALCAAAL